MLYLELYYLFIVILFSLLYYNRFCVVEKGFFGNVVEITLYFNVGHMWFYLETEQGFLLTKHVQNLRLV